MDEYEILLRHHLAGTPWYLMVLAGLLLAVVTCRQHPKLSIMTFVVLCLAPRPQHCRTIRLPLAVRPDQTTEPDGTTDLPDRT
jgi:hypothetical protein